MEKNVAIVLAAGQGKRMNSKVQKQYLLIKEKPVLYYTLKAFEESDLIAEIVLVTGKDETEYCRKEIVEKYDFKKFIRLQLVERKDIILYIRGFGQSKMQTMY